VGLGSEHNCRIPALEGVSYERGRTIEQHSFFTAKNCLVKPRALNVPRGNWRASPWLRTINYGWVQYTLADVLLAFESRR
jgi:hypothetical protein